MPSNYWEQRARNDKKKVIKVGENGINDLKRLLHLNLKDVEEKIKYFYEKYGEDGYKEFLNPKELEKYKLELKKAIKQNPKDQTLKKIFKKDAPLYKIERLSALETDLQIMLAETTTAQEKGIYKTLNDVSKVAQTVTTKTMFDNTRIVFDAISKDKMQKLLSSDWSGMNWSERLWKDREKVGAKVQEILEKGIPQGASLQKMTRELKQATNQSFNDCFRLIRTETAHIDGQVLLESFKQAQKELGYQSYIYDATLDNRTSKICKELNDKRFKIDDAKVGENFPPMHPNCRSTCVLDENSIIET